jgi:hypothetical protein
MWGVFTSEAEATASFDGFPIHPGSVAIEATADLSMTPFTLMWGVFTPEVEALTAFDAVGQREGAFALVAEAGSMTVGFHIALGWFDSIAEVFGEFSGKASYQGGMAGFLGEAHVRSLAVTTPDYGLFTTVGTANVGFVGAALNFGVFSVEGVAATRMFWSPKIGSGPGVADPEEETADAGCLPEPAEAVQEDSSGWAGCLIPPSDVIVPGDASGVIVAVRSE